MKPLVLDPALTMGIFKCISKNTKRNKKKVKETSFCLEAGFSVAGCRRLWHIVSIVSELQSSMGGNWGRRLLIEGGLGNRLWKWQCLNSLSSGLNSS